MTDEKYVFIQDIREKKIAARSAKSTRTHCGKGGAVKFPSDYKTKKELQAMNSEVKSYRLNDPMKWAEFKALPDDLKVSYIKLIRERFNPHDCDIAEMLGVHRVTFSNWIKALGIGSGKAIGGTHKFDKEGWIAWCNGAPIPAADHVEKSFTEDSKKDLASLEYVCECEPEPVVPAPIHEIKTLPARKEKAMVIPCSGSMTLEGRLEDVLNTVYALLGGAKVNLCISWAVCPEGECEHGFCE